MPRGLQHQVSRRSRGGIQPLTTAPHGAPHSRRRTSASDVSSSARPPKSCRAYCRCQFPAMFARPSASRRSFARAPGSRKWILRTPRAGGAGRRADAVGNGCSQQGVTRRRRRVSKAPPLRRPPRTRRRGSFRRRSARRPRAVGERDCLSARGGVAPRRTERRHQERDGHRARRADVGDQPKVKHVRHGAQTNKHVDLLPISPAPARPPPTEAAPRRPVAGSRRRRRSAPMRRRAATLEPYAGKRVTQRPRRGSRRRRSRTPRPGTTGPARLTRITPAAPAASPAHLRGIEPARRARWRTRPRRIAARPRSG